MKAVKRGLLIILAFLLTISLIYSATNIKTNLSTTKYGPNSFFDGYFNLNFTEPMPADSIITFNTGSSQNTINLKDIIKIAALLNNPQVKQIQPHYEKTTGGGEEVTVSFPNAGSKLEVGIDLKVPNRQPADVIVDSASFKIEPSTGTPNDATIYIGNKKVYRHKSGDPTGWLDLNRNYLGDFNPTTNINVKAGDVLCQLVNVNESASYKIKVRIKKEPNSGTVGLNATMSKEPAVAENCSEEAPCCIINGITESFSEKECTLNKNLPENQPQYLCIYPTGGEAGQKYFELKGKDADPVSALTNGVTSSYNFFIYGLYATYNRILNSPTTITLNKQDLQDYILGENGCKGDCLLIPFNISVQSNGGIKFKDLSLVYSTPTDSLTHTGFAKLQYIPESINYTGNIKVDLINFNNLKTPSSNNKYKFFASFNNVKSNEVEFDVVSASESFIRLSNLNPVVGEAVAFDASDSKPYSNRNVTEYLWFFGDGSTSTNPLVTHSYNYSGNYTLKLMIKDSDGIIDTDSLLIIVRNQSVVDIGTLINNTKTTITTFKTNLQTSLPQVKDTASLLNLDTLLNNLETQLNTLYNNYNNVLNNATLTEAEKNTQINSIKNQVNQISRQVPSQLGVDVSTFSSKVTGLTQIPPCCDFTTESLRTKLLNAQKDVTINAEARIVHIIYADGTEENFMVIKKDIIGSGASIYEFVPFGFGTIEVLNGVNFTVPSANVYKFLYTTQLLYKVDLADFSKALQTKTAVLPTNLESIQVAPAATTGPKVTVETECGNKLCEEDEDEESCPKDCKAEESSAGLYFIILVVVLTLLFVYFGFFFKGGLFEKGIKSARSLFKTEKDYSSLKSFVDNALKKGLHEDKVKSALISKGWGEKQVTSIIAEIKSSQKQTKK